MNVGWKRLIAGKDCRDASPWQFYLHCGIEESGIHGMICTVCHQVFRHPSEYRTRSMGKQLLAEAHIARFNQLIKLEVAEMTTSTVDETAWAILSRQGNRENTIVSS